MSSKSERISQLVASLQGSGSGLDAHYLGYFECFNNQRFYEAHDVLEQLWLKERRQANDLFYKGLIQLAGAFVHLQKNRLPPAGALFKLAASNLRQYPRQHQRLDLEGVLALIQQWIGKLEDGLYAVNPLGPESAPKLYLKAV